MNTPEQRVKSAWGRLSLVDRISLWAYAIYLSAILTIREDIMNRVARIAFVAAVVIYIGFFLIYADRFPRPVFFAGFILGVVLGALAVLLLLPRNGHNGNGNGAKK